MCEDILKKIIIAFFVLLYSKPVAAGIFSNLFSGSKFNEIFGDIDFGNFTEILNNDDQSSKNVLDEWLEHMSNFDSNQMFTFIIEPGQLKKFYLDVDDVPQALRGAYTVSAKSSNKIRFTLVDPRKQPLALKEYEKEAIFYPNVTIKGRYVFQFENGNVN